MISAERLRDLFDYDPETGIFVQKARVGSDGRKLKERIAGSIYGNGYIYISVGGIKYLAARLAWLYMTCEWPQHEVDHKNNVRTDNRFDNLRDATELGNSANRGPNKNNRSGFKGVFRHRTSGRWTAQISINGKHTHLGMWDSPQDAARAYDAASLSHFGEFGKTNKSLGLV
jgi:hypothetical protein